MIDIHSHVLPHMDDGSGSTAESLEMLETNAKQGIGCMVATPHFYAEENDPDTFLARRTVCAEHLREAWRPGLPKLILGAEVCYFDGIGRAGQIEDLRIEGTPLLLLEMPFCPWTDRMLSEVQLLGRRQDMTVLLAHIERYMRWQNSDVWDELRAMGALMQCNASFFLNWRTRHKALGMLKKGQIQFLGSDSHNMTTRPPRLGEALKVIGEKGRGLLEENTRRYFPALEG